jgi:hypothetical protein
MATRTLLTTAALAASLWSVSAAAQSATDTKQFAVTGNVPALCVGGTVAATASSFDLGVLVDTSTGLLRAGLASPAKTMAGSFCSARSTITIAATPIVAQAFTGTPPTGFSRGVNYTATASGWTTTPASFTTGAATNAAAVQSRTTAFTGDITVAVSGFTTDGGNALRLVADTSYLGSVTVTLAVAS